MSAEGNESTREKLLRARAGDAEARDALVSENIALVKYIVKRFMNRGAEYDDLFQYGCMGLLKLADRYSVDRLEAACRKALTFTATPSYKSIKNILDTGSDRTEAVDKASVTDSYTNSEKSSHALTRGADYYRR